MLLFYTTRMYRVTTLINQIRNTKPHEISCYCMLRQLHRTTSSGAYLRIAFNQDTKRWGVTVPEFITCSIARVCTRQCPSTAQRC